MPIKLRSSEILRLTVENLGEEIFVDSTDPENLTEEHVLHLRHLVRQRAEKTQTQPVNADELADKLGRLPSRESSPSSGSRSLSVTPTPPPTDEEDNYRVSRGEEEAYDALVADGGRPSHPVSLGPDVVENPPAEYKDIIWFWNLEEGGCEMFRGQLRRWREFRKYQKTTREWYITRDRFRDYHKAIRESQEDLQCTWDLAVYEDPYKQNRLQDWIEFRAFYYRKLQGQRKRTEHVQKRFFHFQKELNDIEPGLGGQIPNLEEHYMTKILDGRKRVQDAKNQVKAAEQELLQARSSHPLCVTTENTFVEEAEQKLALRRKMLDLEYELGLAYGRFGNQLRSHKKWTVYLKWIDDQYPALVTECGYCTGSPVNHRPLLSIKSFTSQTSRRSPRHTGRVPSRSVLGPSPSSEISKPSRNRLDRPRKVLWPSSNEQRPIAASYNPVEQHISLRRSERLRLLRANQSPQGPEISGGLAPIHSSRIAKAKATMHTAKQPILPRQQSTRTRRSTTERRPKMRHRGHWQRV